MSDGTREVTTELKFHEKRAALGELGRHQGIFKEDNDQKKPQVDLDTLELPSLSNEDLIAFLQKKKTP